MDLYPNVNLQDPRIFKKQVNVSKKHDVLRKNDLLNSIFGRENRKTSSDAYETLDPLTHGSKIILRTVMRWMFNNQFMKYFEKTFEITTRDTYYSRHCGTPVDKLFNMFRLYTYLLQEDFFILLARYSLESQKLLVEELERL